MAHPTKVKCPELGARLKSARRRAGLSHDKLGAIVGTSRQHLINLEKGLHRPGATLLSRIAEATSQPVEFFDDGVEQQASADDDSEADPVALLTALMDALGYVRRGSVNQLAEEAAA